MNRIDEEARTLLIESVELEGHPNLLLDGSELKSYSSTALLPDLWIAAVIGDISPSAVISEMWAPVKNHLPRTIRRLCAVTSSFGILTTERFGPSLLYFFGSDKNLYVNRGFLPYRKGRKQADDVLEASTLEGFYGVHDGWIDFFSGDGGLISVAQWRRVQGESESGFDDFIEVYRNSSSASGFVLRDGRPEFMSLNPDEDEVVTIRDFWAWLDDRYVIALEDI